MADESGLTIDFSEQDKRWLYGIEIAASKEECRPAGDCLGIGPADIEAMRMNRLLEHENLRMAQELEDLAAQKRTAVEAAAKAQESAASWQRVAARADRSRDSWVTATGVLAAVCLVLAWALWFYFLRGFVR